MRSTRCRKSTSRLATTRDIWNHPRCVKGKLGPLEYLAWARSVPTGARYDLSASGVRDTVLDGEPSPLGDAIPPDVIARRDRSRSIVGDYVDAVAGRYDIDASCVVPSLGASQAITQVLMALVRPGDHIIVERPTYEPLHRVPEVLGISVSRLERKYDEDWELVPDRLAQLLTPRTRAVVLTNLHNPSGVSISPDRLTEIGEMAARVGAILLVDEVYLDFGFDPHNKNCGVRPACLTVPNAVSWSSTTKCFGYGALRAGWLVASSPEIAKALHASADYLNFDYPVATALLGTRVLERAEPLRVRAQRMVKSGRRIVDRWIDAEQRASWVPPSFGLTGLVRLPDLMQDTKFAQHLRDRYETQVVPGSLFEAPGMVRLSFGLGEGELEQALENFSASLEELS